MINNIKDRQCNLCHNRIYRYLFDNNDYKIIRCSKCGLMTVSPLPDDKLVANLYEKDYFKTGSEGKGYSDYLKEYITKPFIQTRYKTLSNLRDGGRLLDIGCAHGFFLKTCESKFECVGVESSRFASEYGRKKMGLNIITARLEDASFTPGSFDVITCWSVVDHLKDPVDFFQRTNKLLRKGGIFAFNIANTDSLRFHLNNRNWKPIRPPEHLYYYSINNIKELLAKTNFDLNKLTGKGEVGINHVFNNPDLNLLKNGKNKFYLTKNEYLKFYLFGLFCLFSEKIGLGGFTVGSNLDVYAKKK